MDRQILTRSTPEVSATGRTLEGVAFYFDKASKVSDDGGNTFYLESFARGSVTKTLKERSAIPVPLGFERSAIPVPLGFGHPWTKGIDAASIGDVRFEAAEEGLLFRAKLQNTPEASQALELVNTGKHKGASVSFVPYKSDETNGILVRQEVGIYELSLVETPAHQGAGVLAVRELPTWLPERIALDLRYLNL